jgi:hypothetical protein
MGLAELKADCELHRKRLLDSKLPESIKGELAGNLWPFMDSLIDEFEMLAGAVDDLLEDQENILQPEFTARIIGVFNHGAVVCQELATLVESLDDELKKKRLLELIANYRQNAQVVANEVAAVTTDIEMDEEDGEDEADESIEEEDEDVNEEEIAEQEESQ